MKTKLYLTLLLVLQLCMSCNPALQTNIYPTLLTNLNYPINKSIGILDVTRENPELPLYHNELLKEQLASVFSKNEFFVYDLESLGDPKINDVSLIVRSQVKSAESYAPDKIDWLKIGAGFLLILPGYYGYKADKNIERRETTVVVEIELLQPKTNQSLWLTKIQADRGDLMTVAEKDAYSEIYKSISQKLVDVIRNRW